MNLAMTRNRMQSKRKGEIAQRRQKVADLYSQHVKIVDIAQVLGVDKSTISRDIKAIVKGWEAQAHEQIRALRARELAELDRMEADCVMREAEALRLAEEAVPVLRPDASDKERVGREPIKHSPAWERYRRDAREWKAKRLQIKERRAKLMNLDLETPQTTFNTVVPITFIEMGPIARREDRESLESGQVIEGEVVEDGGGS